MANVFRRTGTDGKGRWYIRYADPVTGRDIKKVTKAKTKREAERIVHEMLCEIEDGSYEVKARQRETTFFEICDDFLIYSKAHKRSSRTDDLCIRRLKEFFRDVPVAGIKADQVERYVLQRKNTITIRGAKMKPATVNRELACLKTIFNRAVRDGKALTNPVKDVKLLKENNVRDRVLSAEEFTRLLECSPDYLKNILIAAHETGMRAGELFGLQWEQVNLATGFITLHPDQTKTNEGRKIPISTLLREVLSEIKPKSGPVFRFNGSSIQSVKKSFMKACREAEVEGFRFHDFRHTFVTNMRRAGKQDRVIMAITGHKTMTVFMRYDTVSEDDLKKAVE